MSIGVTFIGSDGIVLATDSRTSIRDGEMHIHRDDERKLWLIENKFGLISIGNNVGYNSYLRKHFTEEVLPKEGIETWDIQELVDKLSSYLQSTIGTLPDELLTSAGYAMEFIVAGYTSNMIPRAFRLSPAQSYPYSQSEISNFHPSGVRSIANYWLNKFWGYLYETKNGVVLPKGNVEGFKKIAIMVIRETAKYCEQVGGAIHMTIIRPGGIEWLEFNEYKLKEIDRHIQEMLNCGELIQQLQRLDI